MPLLNVRRLAALDMHGLAGSRRRRRLIYLEFAAGMLGCVGLGVWSWTTASSTVALAVGAWLIGVGANYVPLFLESSLLLRAGAIDRELAGVDIRREAHHATRSQFWIFVPFSIVFAWLLTRHR
jgi:hypothetical protein